ncbi:MAG: peptidylprolyl isomerase [Planctomycetes bacterium]|nr:peptidylprolyl isomerase [Planctomycetota bacterium]
MFVQILAITALLFGLGQPVEPTRIQDDDAAWAALYAIVPQHVHSLRARVRVTPITDLPGIASKLEELLPRIAGRSAEPIARFYLGNVLFKLDRFDQAISIFESIQRDFPGHGLNLQLGPTEAAMVAAAIADCREEIETRKTYTVMDLPKAELDRSGRAVFHTTEGAFEIQLFNQASPETCANFKKLVREGYYVGLGFHEVSSFRSMALGCPNTRDENKSIDTWGQGGPAWDLPFELNDAIHEPGAVSMRRSASGRSHGSQFTICLSDQGELNNKQVVFGKVVRGIEVLRRLSQRRVDSKGRPEEAIRITGSEWAEGPPGRR